MKYDDPEIRGGRIRFARDAENDCFDLDVLLDQVQAAQPALRRRRILFAALLCSPCAAAGLLLLWSPAVSDPPAVVWVMDTGMPRAVELNPAGLEAVRFLDVRDLHRAPGEDRIRTHTGVMTWSSDCVGVRRSPRWLHQFLGGLGLGLDDPEFLYRMTLQHTSRDGRRWYELRHVP